MPDRSYTAGSLCSAGHPPLSTEFVDNFVGKLGAKPCHPQDS